MSEEATEEKKGKKKKEKKPKKEKPPKEKKPKKEKPKKEKKPKKDAEAPAEEGGKKKGGIPKLVLILVPVFVVLIVAGAFVYLKILRPGSKNADAEVDEAALSEEVLDAQIESADKEKSGAESEEQEASVETDAGEGEGEGEDGETAEAPPPEPVDMSVSMTTVESLDYFRSLTPAALGLPGESMDEYDVFASESLVLVNNVPCKKFQVYSLAGKAGTNDVQGIYFLTQRGARRLYQLDESTGTVTELKWTPPPKPEPEVTAEDELPLDAEDAETETPS